VTSRRPRLPSHLPSAPRYGVRLDAVLVTCVVTAVACSGKARGTVGTASAPAAGAKELSRTVVDPYLNVDAALASDRLEGVKENASQIGAAAHTLGPSAAPIESAAARLAAAAGIDEARVEFGVLSQAIDAHMARQHLEPPPGVRQAFCPMAMRPWLQRDGAIRNPYYGSRMLTCGSFRN
jgi:hypothetical protein